MRPEKFTVAELFRRERRYAVPLYQRPYVWSRDEQWEPLWDDIRGKALATSENTPGVAHNHFLGAIVLNKHDTFGKEVVVSEIIDGQQRLTTLQIFLAAMRDVAERLGHETIVKRVGRLAENEEAEVRPEERFKVWPTNADRESFQGVMTAGGLDQILRRFPQRMKGKQKLPRPRLVEAYLYFYTALETFVRDGDADYVDNLTPQALLENVYDVIRKHLHLIVIELEADDDPQVIFETLNARGAPLLPSDLIRNFVFLQADRRREDTDSLYEKYWRRFDEEIAAPGILKETDRFWKVVERQGRLLRPRIDLFFFYYLAYRTLSEPHIGTLFNDFRTWWLSRGTTAEDGLREVSEHAELFHGFFAPEGSSRLAVFAERLRALDTGTVYPLLLWLAAEQGRMVPQAEVVGILTDLESYLVRRAVCGLTTKNYNRGFMDALRNLSALERVDRGSFQAQLRAGEGDSVRWPDDKEFFAHWISEPVYRSLKSPGCGMILRAIEMHRTTAKQEDIRILGKLEVEHILPRKYLESDYPFTSYYLDEKSIEERRAERQRLLDTFGNLTLLTAPLNKSISNGPFREKRPDIAKHSRLGINTWFQTEGEVWSEEQIQTRARDLFDTATEIWPYPKAARD